MLRYTAIASDRTIFLINTTFYTENGNEIKILIKNIFPLKYSSCTCVVVTSPPLDRSTLIHMHILLFQVLFTATCEHCCEISYCMPRRKEAERNCKFFHVSKPSSLSFEVWSLSIRVVPLVVHGAVCDFMLL